MTTTHTTKKICVQYSAPVEHCARRICAYPPAERGSQNVSNLSWRCFPPPDKTREHADEFGNRVLEIYHRRLTREFRFELEFSSHRHHCNSAREENLPPTGIGAFLLPSARCDSTTEIQSLARALGSTTEFHSKEELATRLCDYTHHALRYDEEATDVFTTASQALDIGAGVCQDYAHLMIALCRAANLPARYVSGYNPSEGAMHAWCEVLCDNLWLAFDPTHNRPTRADCVYVATGRDYRDVAPTRGTFSGRAQTRMQIHCVTRVEEST
ncbi:MAG TPA: transglutaminase family protein [Abditibacteriaceae bacterium]